MSDNVSLGGVSLVTIKKKSTQRRHLWFYCGWDWIKDF